MMKGYLTIFLSLSLSLLTGFLFLLHSHAVNNAWKVRLEGVTDMGMNSVLGEYNICLHDRYGLFYVDASYGGKAPALSHVEERLSYYISRNLQKKQSGGPFGGMALSQIKLKEVVSAASGNGSSMKRQAVQYVKDCELVKDHVDIETYIGELSAIVTVDAQAQWSALMEQIEGMELPKILNEEGEWEEVSLSNPANGVFSMLGSDVLFLVGVDVDRIRIGQIQKSDYISGRGLRNTLDFGDVITGKADTDLFLIYLQEKMGNYRKVRQGSLLQFQLEYIAKGKASDYENIRSVINQLLRWRFAVNALYVFGDAGLHQEACDIAGRLTAVQLNTAFQEPVTRSILYACAYLEAIGDVRCLLSGGRVELHKSHFDTTIEQMLMGEIRKSSGDTTGLTYEQYLICMLYLLPEKTRNLRTMDIMEMDVRSLTRNPYFAMDFCIERYTAEIRAVRSKRNNYSFCRTYGYY